MRRRIAVRLWCWWFDLVWVLRGRPIRHVDHSLTDISVAYTNTMLDPHSASIFDDDPALD